MSLIPHPITVWKLSGSHISEEIMKLIFEPVLLKQFFNSQYFENKYVNWEIRTHNLEWNTFAPAGRNANH